MKWMFQFAIILFITFLGEVMHSLIPWTIPAGIYGMVLLIVCLCLRLIKSEPVEGAADFLVEIMPLCFIPAGVGLMEKWSEFQRLLLPLLIAVFVITILVFVVTGRVAQFIVRCRKGRRS